MSSIASQTSALGFPYILKHRITRELHPRHLVLCTDTAEYAVTIHPTNGNNPQIYYHGSREACLEAYGDLSRRFELRAPKGRHRA